MTVAHEHRVGLRHVLRDRERIGFKGAEEALAEGRTTEIRIDDDRRGFVPLEGEGEPRGAEERESQSGFCRRFGQDAPRELEGAKEELGESVEHCGEGAEVLGL